MLIIKILDVCLNMVLLLLGTGARIFLVVMFFLFFFDRGMFDEIVYTPLQVRHIIFIVGILHNPFPRTGKISIYDTPKTG